MRQPIVDQARLVRLQDQSRWCWPNRSVMVQIVLGLWVGLWVPACVVRYGDSRQEERRNIRALKVGAPVADFAANDINGEIVWLGKYVRIGEEEPEQPKEVLVNFFATWCPSCRRELPQIAAYQRRNPGVQVMVVAEPSKDLKNVVTELLGDSKGQIPVIEDPDMKIVKIFFGPDPHFVLPCSFLISADGKIAARIYGFYEEVPIEQQLAASRHRNLK
ncbi:MAG: TlpA family protein disulfide reductase [Myxococcales bacterium]|nr:TlpA family protein disulfide reductase [Myxococcales bacterium]